MVKVKFTLDRQTDRQGDSYIPPPPNFVCEGYKNLCDSDFETDIEEGILPIVQLHTL